MIMIIISSLITLQTPCFNTCHPDILQKYPAVKIQNRMSTNPPLENARVMLTV